MKRKINLIKALNSKAKEMNKSKLNPFFIIRIFSPNNLKMDNWIADNDQDQESPQN
jgi:hypothetical protein